MSKKKCIVFIHRTFPVGGIETLIVRVAKNLLEKRGAVVVCGTTGVMSNLLPSNVDFFPVNGYVDLIRRLSRHLKHEYSNYDFILVSMHPRSLLAAYALRYLLWFNRVQSFHLVTHSRAFFFNTRFSFLNYLLKSIFFRAPQTSTYFMNDAALKAHESEWAVNLSDYPIIRLPLNAVDPTWVPKCRDSLKLVSVGRLVPFKAYNHSASSIARKLIDLGVSLKWDIYGDGEDRDRILTEIERCGVSGVVNLKGPIAYTDFFRTINDYDVFIGMGTALLEAAQIGMPSICAIDGDGDNSYGLFYEAPSDSVGDVVSNHPKTQIIDVLTFLNDRTPEEMRSIGLKCSESALKRSDGVSNFTNSILGSSFWRIDCGIKNLILLFIAYVLFILFDMRYKN
ncbi:MAG: glycosyltransferase [Nitrosomonas sp.]